MAKDVCIPPTGKLDDLARQQLKTTVSGDSKSVRAVASYFRDSLFVRSKNALLEIYINGLLSRPSTFVSNLAGTAFSITSSIFERGYAALRNAGRDEMGGVSFKEANILAKGMMDAVPQSLKKFVEVMKADTFEAVAAKTDFVNPRKRAVSSEAFGVGGNVAKFIDFVGDVVNYPGKLLLASDEALKMVNYAGQKNALIHREALRRLGRNPKTLNDFNQVRNITSELNANTPREIREQAQEFANINTFTNDLPDRIEVDKLTKKRIEKTGFQKGINQALQNDPTGLGKVFVPFFKTPVQLLNFVGQRTPGLRSFSQDVVSAMKGEQGLAAQQLAEAKLATGLTLYSAGIGLAMSGLITGAAPTDPVLAQRWRDAQIQPNSWYDSETGQYTPINKADPISVFLLTSANLATLAKSFVDINGYADEFGTTSQLFDAYQESLSDAVFALAHVISDRHYLQGVAIFVDGVSGDPRFMKRMIKTAVTPLNPLGTFYGSFRRGINKGMDSTRDLNVDLPSVGEAGDEVLDVVYKKFIQVMKLGYENFVEEIPGFSKTKFPKLNYDGNATFHPGMESNADLHLGASHILHKAGDTLKALTLPIRTSTLVSEKTDPITRRVVELDISLKGAESTESYLGMQLSDEEANDFQTKWAELNKEHVHPRMKALRKLPEEEEKYKLRALLTETRKAAGSYVLKKYTRLQVQFMNDKQFEKDALGRRAMTSKFKSQGSIFDSLQGN